MKKLYQGLYKVAARRSFRDTGPTSKDIKKKFNFLKDVYWGTDGIWSDGYFVSTVGINEEIIKKYIEQQGKEDSGQAQLVLGCKAD